MNRSEKILQMALNIRTRRRDDLSNNGNESRVNGKFGVASNEGCEILEFFKPPVGNETASSFANGFEFDLSSICDSFLFFEYENVDDVLNDPDFVPRNYLTNSDTSEETEQAGEMLENTLRNYENEEMGIVPEMSEMKAESKKSRKLKRNTGKAYLNYKNKPVDERKLRELEDCRKRCKEKLTLEQRNAIFEKYWSLGSYELRHAYVCGLIEIQEKKTERRNKSQSAARNRTHTNYYYFEINGQRISVCQKCFRYTLCETEQFIKTVVRKKLNSSTPNKLGPEKEKEIRDHINSFPAYESHYTRRDSSQNYLPSELSLAQMYRLYCETHERPSSISSYSTIFKTMNIKFKQPKIDTCNKCELLKIKLELGNKDAEIALKFQQDQHQKEADLAYKSKAKDKDHAKNNLSSKLYTFDLQQCLPTPYLQTSVSFYKRPLWTFNLTVHDCVTGQPFCFMWHEAIGRRGGNDIASCIFRHLQSVPADAKHLTFYSDCCSGQNKNTFVATMFAAFMSMKTDIEVIDHKFLVPGHTHMECDVDHSVIEKKKKRSRVKIHHPRDWYLFVRTSGVRKEFIVNEMATEDFLNFSLLSKEKFLWRKCDEDGNKFVWQNVKWLRYTKEFGHIYYKTSLNEDEPFKILNVQKRGISSISSVSSCYSGPLKIDKLKKKDLIDVLPLIDPTFHNFYQSLLTDDMPAIHPDLSQDTDDEL